MCLGVGSQARKLFYFLIRFGKCCNCSTKLESAKHSDHYPNKLVTFGVLFNDDRCANIFEALVGTLRAAKKRKVVAYDGELLLQGVHDNVEITLKPEATASDAV
ncbi:UNVERIFIED_CONTAM: Costars family protein [Sesamum radiatum]|uniref:Costars family protein n=1 Tax=Sesamum radiatum TaxID=300843 RepID=A0AAW2MY34_SESRA